MADKGPVFIIGYGPSIAAGFAALVAKKDHPLVLIARDQEKLTAAAAELSARGASAIGIAADAGDASALERSLGEATATFGEPDLLLYNAAHWRPGPVLNATPRDLVADLCVDVVGALVAAKVVGPGMVERGRGSILFTGGGLALHPSPQAPSLSIGKAGLRALALMLAEELAPKGVRVGTVTVAGTVAPGTPFAPDRIAQALYSLHQSAPDPATAEIVFRG